jgi:hypothetical protein
MLKRKLFGAVCLITSLGLVSSASAAIVTFTGGDVGANQGDPHPLSDAAALSFDTAAGLLGSESLINFESAPLGTFSSLTAAPGVTITGSDFVGGNQSINNTPSGSPSSVYGYNTTPSGSQYLNLNGGNATFSFATPIQAFGAYLTGVQLDGETINFSDGQSESVPIPNLGSGCEFVGFTDAGASIASIEINVQTANSGDCQLRRHRWSGRRSLRHPFH